MVKAGVLQNTDPRFIELQDWEEYQERVKDQSFQTINERFASRDDFRHWVKTGRVPVDPLTTPIDPPVNSDSKPLVMPQDPEDDVGQEEEELPSVFPDKAPAKPPEPTPTPRLARKPVAINNGALKKAFYGVGILASLLVIIWFGSLIAAPRANNQPGPTQEPAVAATPQDQAVSQPAVTVATNTPQSQPLGNRIVRINLHQELPEAYREIVFSNTSSLWVADGATLTGKNNPWAETLGVWGPGTHYLPEADPASDAIGYVEIDCPAGSSDEVVAKLWENNPQEDDRFGYGWEFRIFANGSYEYLAP